MTVLCASNHKILCRARVARFFAAIVAIFAGIAFVKLVMSINAGSPQHFGDKVRGQCLTMPADTFKWGQQMIVEHKCMQKGLAFLSHHHFLSNDTMLLPPSLDTVAQGDASHPAVLDSAAQSWSQPEACNKVAHIVSRVAKMMMTGSALMHLLLLSAVAVVKCACC